MQKSYCTNTYNYDTKPSLWRTPVHRMKNHNSVMRLKIKAIFNLMTVFKSNHAYTNDCVLNSWILQALFTKYLLTAIV